MLVVTVLSCLPWVSSQRNMSNWARWDGWVGGNDGLKPLSRVELSAARKCSNSTDRHILMDKSLCLEESRPMVRGVKLRTGPMRISGLQIVLLRSAAKHFIIVDTTNLGQLQTYPRDSEVLINLQNEQLPLLGQAGDCLGWVLPVDSTCGIVPISDSASKTVYQSESLSVAFQSAVGARVRFGGKPMKRKFDVVWHTTGTFQSLLKLPPSWRLRHLKSMINSLGDLRGISSVAFKKGLLRLFDKSHWAERAVVEIGTLDGGTTLLLSVAFARVYTSDIHVGMHHTMLNNPRKLGPLPNVVPLHVNANLPYAFSMLQGDPGIKAAVIDGDHAYASVVKNIFSVLHDIPSCCDVLVFHDYCDDQVFAAVDEFTRDNVLSFRQSIGDDPGRFWWCKEGRPEGAVFDILNQATKQHNIELTYWRIMFGIVPPFFEGVRQRLQGTSWLVMETDYPIGVFVLGRNFQLDFQALHISNAIAAESTHTIGLLTNLRWVQNAEAETRNNAFALACYADLRGVNDAPEILGTFGFSDPMWQSFEVWFESPLPIFFPRTRLYAVHYTLLKSEVEQHMAPYADVRVR